MIKELKVNDFFCGAGGMGLGFNQAGFRLAGAWDLDKDAVKSYGYNISPKVKQEDIRKMTANDIPRANVWTFGAPCQAFSLSGERLGMTFKCTECGHEEMFTGDSIVNRSTYCTECDNKSVPKDIRGLMLFEIMRLLKETEEKPEVILLENVKGIKKFFPVIEEEYNKRGYKMYQNLYNSKYYLPQNRERYFIVGVRNDIEKKFNYPKQNENAEFKIFDILETQVNDNYTLSDKAWEGHRKRKLQHINKGNGFGYMLYDQNSTYTSTITARYYKDGSEILIKQEGRNPRRLTPREAARLQGFPDSFEQVVSNTQFYKQMGNAVSVPVAKAIAESIKDFIHSYN